MPPNVDLPGEVGAEQEIWQRIGEILPGKVRQIRVNGSQWRKEAGLLHPRAGSEHQEWPVRAATLEHLVVGDPNLLGQDFQLLVACEALPDVALEHRVFEKLPDADLR